MVAVICVQPRLVRLFKIHFILDAENNPSLANSVLKN